MRTPRDVYLTIGKGTYTLNSSIENEDFDRIRSLIDDACGEIIKGAKQEDVLMLTCVRLAYALDTVNGKLKKILEKIEESN
ncbi:MAG: hypothetical protein IJS40_08045 [Synergistaceae bacterium]|nr:hypothetical protein [Synergistaceae bacterium]